LFGIYYYFIFVIGQKKEKAPAWNFFSFLVGKKRGLLFCFYWCLILGLIFLSALGWRLWLLTYFFIVNRFIMVEDEKELSFVLLYPEEKLCVYWESERNITFKRYLFLTISPLFYNNVAVHNYLG